MAGVLKVRDAGGTLRTITAVKVRDAGGALRTLSFIKVRDAGGTLREVFTSGGGGGNPTYITPGYYYIGGTHAFRQTSFTGASSGAAPSSYSWGVLAGPGSIVSGGSSATATVGIYGSDGEVVTAMFYCDMVVSGVTYRAICQFDYEQNTGIPG